MRHPLARALGGVGLDTIDVAARLQVDPKTVRRWLTGRVPYPRHQAALAEITGWTTRDLWPGQDRPAPPSPTSDETLAVYPNRSVVPSVAWHRLFQRAERGIDILGYSALFLAEDTTISRLLTEKARIGVQVRIALGDPDGVHIAQRGNDERLGDLLAARIRNAILLYRPLTDEPGAELRLHDTVLYSSIYRADDDLIVNTHVLGCPASRAPALALRRRHPDGLAASYIETFERIWTAACLVSTSSPSSPAT